MKAQASIQVQFKPFVLTLARDGSGQWCATLCRMGEEQQPIVVALTATKLAPPHVSFDSGMPRLRIGAAEFAVPARQLQRLREWIDAELAPAPLNIEVIATSAHAGGSSD